MKMQTSTTFRFVGLALLAAVLLFPGCTDDPIIDNPLGPEISFEAGAGIVSSDTELTVGTPFTVRLLMQDGDEPLQSLRIEENGTVLSFNNLSFSNGLTPNNPLLIPAADELGATYDVTITPSRAEEGLYTYSFLLADDGVPSLTDQVDVTITYVPEPGTALDSTLTGVLFNQGGAAGTGGLDLEKGEGVGSQDAAAEIRDLGLDCTIDPSTNPENWRQQIGSVNGADMVAVDPMDVGDNFSFDAVDTKEVIVAAYNAGRALADGTSTNCGNGNETAVTDVSDTVAVGDLFAVLANGVYYLIRIDEVNLVANSNDDNYSISIKY
jgi:hypothetical protein